jgi:hydrophobic/amphiphilic exporter-1 (mainly G- bacteria), HAE1 family
MTAMCTELGLLPMALSRGGAASLWSPLAMTVVGGLITGTILTLIIIPLVYYVVEDLRGMPDRLRKRRTSLDNDEEDEESVET